MTAKVDELTTQVNELKASNEALKSENETLKAESKTDEEKEILDTVAKAGGKKWLDNLGSMSSTFNASNRKFVARGEGPSQQQEETRSQRMLREQREAQEAKRKARSQK